MIFGEGPIIKNIAGDLNKLFLQGTRGSQPIINVEGDAAADQATVQLMADRDPVIRDISTGLGWAEREVTVSGTGALQLVNSLGRPLKSWSVELAPYQEGSGDPSPENVRPIHGTNRIKIYVENSYDPSATPKAVIDVPALGKNILNIGAGTHNAWSFVNIPNNLKPNTQYTLSLNGGTTYYYGLYLGDRQQSTRALTPAITGGESATFTTPSDMSTEPLLALAGSVSGAGNESLSNILPQVEIGPTKTSYEPYTNTLYSGTVGSEGGESRWGEVDLGVLTWKTSSSTQHGFYATIPILYAIGNNIPAMCEAYKYIGTRSGDSGYYGNNGELALFLRMGQSYSAECYIVDDRYSYASDFKAAVQGVKLVFNMETPIEFTIPTHTIPTTEGNGSVWISAENGIVTSFSVTYLQGE